MTFIHSFLQLAELFAPVQRAILAGKNRELTLERAIVRAMTNVDGETWYNQFNVASGIAGSHSDRKTSVDLVRHVHATDEYTFIELKDWKATDSPLRVLYEIVCYGMMFNHVKRLLQNTHQSRYQGHMLRMDKIRLAAMLPEVWAKQYRNREYAIPPEQVFHFAALGLVEAQKSDARLLPGVLINPTIYYLREYRHDQLADLLNQNEKIRAWVLGAVNQA